MIKLYSSRLLCNRLSVLAINLFTVFVTVFNVGSLHSQDPHFSQFYASPILLNPALTGNFPGDVRVSGCYREQWPSVMYPFRTGTFSADANILHGLVKDGDIAGIGLTGLFDNTNNGGLKSNSLSSSISFHKSLYNDGSSNYTIGVGFMGTLNTKILDYSRFVFGEQLTQTGFDPRLATGENKNGFTTNFFDYSAGILYSAVTENNSFYLGGSMYHINKPNEAFNGPAQNIMPRYVLHSGGSFLSGDAGRIYYSGVYMKSESFSELTLGLVYGYNINNSYYDESEEIILLAGVWYRYKDAVIPHIGIQYGNARIGLSYDVNVSQLETASNLKGGFEVALSYTFATTEDARNRRATQCPKGKQSSLKWFGY